MAKYKFPVKEVTYHEGYTIVKVVAGLADINENDPQRRGSGGRETTKAR
jgi:hypothetical protein